MFTSNEDQTGNRLYADDVAIVITGGESKSDSTLTIPTAERAHQQNIHIFAVGITDSVNVTLILFYSRGMGDSRGLVIENHQYFVLLTW